MKSICSCKCQFSKTRYVLNIAPVKFDRGKQLATDVILKTSALSYLEVEEFLWAVVGVDHNGNFFFDSLYIVTPRPICTFLKLRYYKLEVNKGRDKRVLHLREVSIESTDFRVLNNGLELRNEAEE